MFRNKYFWQCQINVKTNLKKQIKIKTLIKMKLNFLEIKIELNE